MSLKIGDLVKCPRLGQGNYEIVDENTHEYVIRDEKGQSHNFYKVHCHPASVADRIAHRKTVQQARVERAEKIGRKNR